MAAVETVIAVAVILGFARKLTYISAAAFSVLIWAVAEGFGGPYTSGASDIGTAIIYTIVFVGLLELMAYTGPARYSVDYYLEQKISWWWKVAEIRRPVQEQTVLAALIPAQSAAHTFATTDLPAATGPAGPMGPAGPAGPMGPAGPAGAATNGARPEPATH